jgi:hypothetical protein
MRICILQSRRSIKKYERLPSARSGHSEFILLLQLPAHWSHSCELQELVLTAISGLWVTRKLCLSPPPNNIQNKILGSGYVQTLDNTVLFGGLNSFKDNNSGMKKDVHAKTQ